MRYIGLILYFLTLNNSFAQSPVGEGGIKFGFIQNDNIVFLNDTITVKFINQDFNEVVLDTIYLSSEKSIPAKLLPVGTYQLEILFKEFPIIEVTDITVENGKISFIEQFDIGSLIDRKEILKLKYKKPTIGYKSCG